MTVGPLRRLTGALGLAALVPTAVLLATGSLTPRDAGVRAVVTLAGVLLLGRLAEHVVAWLLRAFEQRQHQAAAPSETES